MRVTVRDELTPQGAAFERALKELEKLEVRVGFQRGRAQEEDGTDMVDIAAWNELGTENIPSRPFLAQSVDRHAGEINAFLRARMKDLTNGVSAKQVLSEIGLFQKDLIQDEILNGGFVPNAAATIRRKGSSQPLIDTGRMRQSVNYVVQQKGGSD